MQMEMFTKESGKTEYTTAIANTHGQMEVFTRESGKMVKGTDMANAHDQMEMFTRESSQTEKGTDMANTHMQMDMFTRESGKTENGTAKELKCGQIKKGKIMRSDQSAIMLITKEKEWEHGISITIGIEHAFSKMAKKLKL